VRWDTTQNRVVPIVMDRFLRSHDEWTQGKNRREALILYPPGTGLGSRP